jgi:glycosyltransferase involved in cell wall biosynthesis
VTTVSRLRILHCIPGFGGGGAERQLSYLAPELSRRGLDVHVAFLHDGPNLQPLRDGGVSLHRLESRSNLDLRLAGSLLRLVRVVRPHVIHSWILQMDVIGGAVASLTSTPHLLSERAVAAAYDPGWRRRAREYFGRRAAAIVANSAAGLGYWRRMTDSPIQRVIANAVPVAELDAIARAARTEPYSPRRMVISAGRLAPQKNVVTLLQAMSRVGEQLADTEFVVCGEGPQRELLLATRDGLPARERMHILPYVTDLSQRVARASVFVSASLFEGAPNTVLEAAALGCPLVLSDIPEHRELLDHRAALFVRADAVEEIAAAIRAVLQDPRAAAERARHAREQIEHLSVAQIAAEYEQCYRQIARARPQ